MKKITIDLFYLTIGLLAIALVSKYVLDEWQNMFIPASISFVVSTLIVGFMHKRRMNNVQK